MWRECLVRAPSSRPNLAIVPTSLVGVASPLLIFLPWRDVPAHVEGGRPGHIVAHLTLSLLVGGAGQTVGVKLDQPALKGGTDGKTAEGNRYFRCTVGARIRLRGMLGLIGRGQEGRRRGGAKALWGLFRVGHRC